MGILAKRQSEEAQVEHLEDTMNRQAGALAEVQRIHADNMRMHDLAERNRREIERVFDIAVGRVVELPSR